LQPVSGGVALRTRLCRELGIEYPIFSVGFGRGAGPELVAAVSNAGGCGVLGGSSLPAEEIPRQIARTRELTGRPFGINFILAALEHPHASAEERESVAAQVEAAVSARVPLVVFFWGPAALFVEDAHRNGVKVFIQVGSVAEAEAAATAGVDAVIVQGLEAGGHVRGTTSIWDLLPAAVEAVGPLPVLAAGGIGDAAGLARALQLGAAGVSLGTRFVASDEAWVHPLFKQRVVESGAGDTFYGDLFDVGWPDAPHRVLRKNKTFAEWDSAGRPPPGKRPGEGTEIGTEHRPWGDYPMHRYEARMVTPDFDGDPDYAPFWAGESCAVVNDIKPASMIVRDLVREVKGALGHVKEHA
jgi:nitronate monooxygenase